jgi:hypothetical protein
VAETASVDKPRYARRRFDGFRCARSCAGVPALIAVTALSGCESGGRAGGPAVADSAGVTLVVTREPAWNDSTAWRIDPTPVLELGAVDGPPEAQFDRIEGVLRLPDGRLVVADGGSAEIRFFDRGGPGDAPGEYRNISGLGRGPGDSLWVYDFGARRVTVLSAVGRVGRTLTVPDDLSNVGAVGRLPDGSFVLQEHWSTRSQTVATRMGLQRSQAAVARLSSDGTQLDTVGVYPGREVFISNPDGRAVMSAPLAAHATSAAIWNGQIAVGDQERFQLEVLNGDGEPRRVVRVEGEDLALGASDVRRLMEVRLSTVPTDSRQAARAHLESMAHPDTRPAYGDLLADTEGNLWVAEYAPDPLEPRSWSVLAPGGALLGRVGMPESFELRQAGADWVVGVWRDELGVEFVRMHALLKQPDPLARP